MVGVGRGVDIQSKTRVVSAGATVRRLSWEIGNPMVIEIEVENRLKGVVGWRKKEENIVDIFAWLISFFLLIALLALVTYQLMCLADLEFDYINPYDSSSRINMVVLPEFFLQALLFCFYLVTGNWIMSLFAVPYLYFNVRLYRQGKHLIDVTEIFNLLSWEKKQRLVKLLYLVSTLFLSVFWVIYTSLDD